MALDSYAMTPEEFSTAFEAGYVRTVRLLIKKGCRDAEDIASEGWATAWEKRGQFCGAAKFHSWVAAISINAWRKKWRRDTLQSALVGNGVFHSKIESAIQARQLVSHLCGKDQQLIAGRYSEDREFNEIASTSEAGRLKVHRAMKVLRLIAA